MHNEVVLLNVVLSLIYSLGVLHYRIEFSATANLIGGISGCLSMNLFSFGSE